PLCPLCETCPQVSEIRNCSFAHPPNFASVSAFVKVSLLCHLVWLGLFPALAQSETEMASPPAVAVPPLNFERTTLENGLQVYTVEDHKSPTVAVQVWYHVGSKDDPPSR